MGAWENCACACVVICQNKKFHKHNNAMFGHKFPLTCSPVHSIAQLRNVQLAARHNFNQEKGHPNWSSGCLPRSEVH